MYLKLQISWDIWSFLALERGLFNQKDKVQNNTNLKSKAELILRLQLRTIEILPHSSSTLKGETGVKRVVVNIITRFFVPGATGGFLRRPFRPSSAVFSGLIVLKGAFDQSISSFLDIGVFVTPGDNTVASTPLFSFPNARIFWQILNSEN